MLVRRPFMLSAGSRRKVGLVALLASGATLTCIDQPYVALDLALIGVLCEFLVDMVDHPLSAWVVADYKANEAFIRSLLRAPSPPPPAVHSG